MVVACYGILLHVVTEPWRVYGNDYRAFFWTIPALLGTAGIVMGSLRWPRVWLLGVMLLPLFLVSRQQIINQRLRDGVVSCGNHSSFWGDPFFDGSTPLPGSTEFAEFLVALHQNEPEDLLRGRRCPGYRRAGTQTGVVFVGGGLLLASLSADAVLVAFCSWQCHPIPHDHQHCLVWERSEVNGKYEGVLTRHCSETRDMIGRIERALQQAQQGLVPYSGEACRLLTEELRKRKEIVDGTSARPED